MPLLLFQKMGLSPRLVSLSRRGQARASLSQLNSRRGSTQRLVFHSRRGPSPHLVYRSSSRSASRAFSYDLLLQQSQPTSYEGL